MHGLNGTTIPIEEGMGICEQAPDRTRVASHGCWVESEGECFVSDFLDIGGFGEEEVALADVSVSIDALWREPLPVLTSPRIYSTKEDPMGVEDAAVIDGIEGFEICFGNPQVSHEFIVFKSLHPARCLAPKGVSEIAPGR